MALGIPLLIMMALVGSAWGLGVLGRERGAGFLKAVGALGVLTILAAPVLFDLFRFDGMCLDVSGNKTPCTLGERAMNSLELGFGLTVPPAIMWVVAFVISARLPR